MKKIVIIGSGGFAKEVAFLIDEINHNKPQWELVGFIDSEVGKMNGKYKIIGDDNWLEDTTEQLSAIIGIGNPILLKKIYTKFSNKKNINFPNLIHPRAIGDWDYISMGIGNIITAGTIFTTDIKIGNFNIFNINSTIGHDVNIGSFNVINPTANISGAVHLDQETLIGTGAQILQNKTICSKVIVGAGSVVTKDLTIEGIYVGVPAVKII